MGYPGILCTVYMLTPLTMHYNDTPIFHRDTDELVIFVLVAISRILGICNW